MIIIFDTVHSLFFIRFEQCVCLPHQVNRQFPAPLGPLRKCTFTEWWKNPVFENICL